MTDKVIITDPPLYKGHIVPCQIHYSGPAKTQEYFTPSKAQQGSNNVAFFRGCKFVGRRLDISKYDAYLLDKSESLASDGDYYKMVNSYTTVGRLESLLFYEQDRLPLITSKYMLMTEWEKLSNIIHDDESISNT